MFSSGDSERVGDLCDGTRRLLRRILIVAVFDAIGKPRTLGDSRKVDITKLKKSARRWLSSNEIYCSPILGISFAFICESLDLETNHVRGKVCKFMTSKNDTIASGPMVETDQG